MIDWRAATFTDIALLGAAGARRAKRLCIQINMAPSWVCEAGGKPVILCGAAPCGELIECWFSVLPAMAKLPSRNAVLRDVLMKVATYEPERDLIVRIRDENRAGQRMASLAGFTATQEEVMPGLRTWWRKSAPSLSSSQGSSLTGTPSKQHGLPADSLAAPKE